MSAASPDLAECREPLAPGLVLFVHGFTGSAGETWSRFPELLREDPDLDKYDFYFWGYPTTLNLLYTVTKYVWTDDPNIPTIGQGLRTLLNNTATRYERLVLIGHSMGGLIIQAFILEELAKERTEHIDRLTEVILFGTPSGGLKKANWAAVLKNQVEDMSQAGSFIADLRSQWKLRIDDRRADPRRTANFRLTLAAGMKDAFVPQESSLDPFPFDEKEIVPGNHTQMVKPSSPADLSYRVVKLRLQRGTLTAQQWRAVRGESEDVVSLINRVRAAEALGDVDDLMATAGEVLNAPPSRPLVDRELGLALLEQQEYGPASKLLERYLRFCLPGGERPFGGDVQAIQQLAIAMSGSGDLVGAVTRINQLPPPMLEDPESQGILAGRFKRQWLKTPKGAQLGWRAFELYRKAFETARFQKDLDQALYNGINAAYLNFALGGTDFQPLAEQVLLACDQKASLDYWGLASRAEANLLCRDYGQAESDYEQALRQAPSPRRLATTAVQAIDIITRQGHPPDAAPIVGRLAPYATNA